MGSSTMAPRCCTPGSAGRFFAEHDYRCSNPGVTPRGQGCQSSDFACLHRGSEQACLAEGGRRYIALHEFPMFVWTAVRHVSASGWDATHPGPTLALPAVHATLIFFAHFRTSHRRSLYCRHMCSLLAHHKQNILTSWGLLCFHLT